MPASSLDFRAQIAEYLWTFPRHSWVLDIGAGAGTYADLLAGHFHHIDALEIWLPYVEQYNLYQKYSNVFVKDICQTPFIGEYNIVIFGGVLEHLSVQCATRLLNRLSYVCDEIIVKVPYNTPQGAVNDNPHEIHKQDDLTHEIMLERYPMLEGWLMNNRCGVYRLRKDRG